MSNRRQFLSSIPAGIAALWAARPSALDCLYKIWRRPKITVLVGADSSMHALFLGHALRLDRSLRVVAAIGICEPEFHEVADRYSPDLAVISGIWEPDNNGNVSQELIERRSLAVCGLMDACGGMPLVLLGDLTRQEIVREALGFQSAQIVSSKTTLGDFCKHIRDLHQEGVKNRPWKRRSYAPAPIGPPRPWDAPPRLIDATSEGFMWDDLT